jgi:hypothetical protein
VSEQLPTTKHDFKHLSFSRASSPAGTAVARLHLLPTQQQTGMPAMRTSVSIAFFAAALCSSTLTPAAPPTTYRVTEFGADDSATKFTSEVAA